MAFRPKMKSTEITQPVNVEGVGDCSVTLRRPTWQERLDDENLVAAGYRGTQPKAWGLQIAHRFSSVITGWQGVVDDAGNPIPFTFDNLTAICAEYPLVFLELDALVNR